MRTYLVAIYSLSPESSVLLLSRRLLLLVVEGEALVAGVLWSGPSGLSFHLLLGIALCLCSRLLLILLCMIGLLLLSSVPGDFRFVPLLIFSVLMHLCSAVRNSFRFPLAHHSYHHRLAYQTVAVLVLVMLTDPPPP